MNFLELSILALSSAATLFIFVKKAELEKSRIKVLAKKPIKTNK